MDAKEFASAYGEAFGPAAGLPLLFWYSDGPVRAVPKVEGCFFKALAEAREGSAVSLNAANIGCGGGKFYTGFAPMPPFVPAFVSQKEHYKQTPEMVLEFIGRLGVPEEDVVGAMDAVSTPVSLYEPVYTDGGDPLTVMDQVRDVKNTDEQWLESIALRQAMQDLSERERRILALRFYDGRTQMEVAGSLGISQAQVSRLEKGALASIRKAIRVS